MKHLPELAQTSDPSSVPEASAITIRGPIEFRFVLQFAAQLSTPCSRGLGIKPRSEHLLVRHAPRLFQSHLQRHSVLQ
jgi:hypothetical protein